MSSVAAPVIMGFFGQGHVAPEVYMGQDDYDESTVNYQMALLIYQSLTGQPAFPNPRKMKAWFQATQRADFKKVTELRPFLPKSLDQVFSQTLRHDKADRIQSIAELRDKLSDIAEFN